ncbi:MAG: hypothetical protein KAT56_01350 [Sedimentisphaerales bacterium]|nr:hypothetical protein [Sedimentisphaerales bacterium]
MIDIKTVLVLGAGASMEFGFPSGDELAYEICRPDAPASAQEYHESGTSIEKKFATGLGFDWKDVKRFKNALAISQLSVDAFLENRKDNNFYEIGRCAIAKVLLACEKPNRLFIGKQPYVHFEDMRAENRKEQRAGNWYKLLWERLVDPYHTDGSTPESCRLSDRFGKNNLSIITFNYERSLEYFLFKALQNNTGMDDRECVETFKKIKIVHVYGSLGLLPWESEEGIPYDSNVNDSGIVRKAANNIRLLRSGETSESEALNSARILLRDADRIFFLGFGFDQMNIDRLLQGIRGRLSPGNVYGTSRGLSLVCLSRIGRIMSNKTPLFRGLQSDYIYKLLHDSVTLV